MLDDFGLINRIVEEHGSPIYVFDEAGFADNFFELQNVFQKVYQNYRISYSFKTNYTPFIAATVKRLGGYAEVVSDMEYSIAKAIGYADEHIIYNGPNKGEGGVKAFLNGCILNVDNLDELNEICKAAQSITSRQYEIGLRVNIDVGQGFVSRFGIDVTQIPEAFRRVQQIKNLKIVGLHCHISRCRGIDGWKKRAQTMVSLAKTYFEAPPKYIDLGSGMFGKMDPEFAAQFENVPSYQDYAQAVAGIFANHYGNTASAPILFTEPGTTLINKYIDFIGRVDAIKCVRNQYFAILNCSEHNLGETCTLKELPMRVFSRGKQRQFKSIDITGYTCLEQDVMRKNYSGGMEVGDYVVFGNVGGYSTVLKPPFIRPNCKMIALRPNGDCLVIKHAESNDDILRTYVF